jgi:hypothetical protein
LGRGTSHSKHKKTQVGVGSWKQGKGLAEQAIQSRQKMAILLLLLMECGRSRSLLASWRRDGHPSIKVMVGSEGAFSLFRLSVALEEYTKRRPDVPCDQNLCFA